MNYLNEPINLDKLPEYFFFLDIVRDTGVTNMYGAASYLIEHMECTKREASAIVYRYMNRDTIKKEFLESNSGS